MWPYFQSPVQMWSKVQICAFVVTVMVTLFPPAYATGSQKAAVGQQSNPRHIRAARDCPANIDSVAFNGLTPLQKAAGEGNLAEVRHLVKACGASVDILGSRGSSALHEAAFSQRPDVISFLIESGAKPDLRKTDGWAAIHLAILGSNPVPTIRALLDGGASADLKTQGGGYEVTPAQLAMDQGKKQVKEFLETYTPADNGAMECLDEAVRNVNSDELIQIFRDPRPFGSLLKLLNDLLTKCRLQHLISSF